MPNNLTLTSAAYAASSPFGQALSAGRGVTSAPVILSTPFTVSLRVKCVPSGGVRVAASQDLVFWIAINAAGNAIANYWNGTTNVPINSTIPIGDDVWHHIQLSVSSAGASLYVDGNLAISSATPGNPSSYANNFEVGRFQNSFNWQGSLDEVAVFTGIKNTAAFTPPAAPYANNEASMLAVWHLDGNGNDSISVASVISANNSSIYYSPYNWLVTAGNAKTINSGAYFKTLFSGDSCVLKFDMTGNIEPFSKIKIVVDGITNQFATVAAVVPVTMPTGQDNQVHLIEVYVDATSRSIDRWSVQQTAVKFTQMEITGGAGTVSAPEIKETKVLIFGDSITDGTRTLNDTALIDVDQDSSSVGWVNRIRNYLNAEIGAVGFASQGINANGVGAVPRLNLAYNLLWAGQARNFTPEPDYVIWLMGTNDAANNTQPNGILALNGMMAAMPTAKFVLFRPFVNTSQEANLQAIIAGCSDPSRAVYISTAGYWAPADSSDNLHPYGYAGDKIAIKMAQAINDEFNTGVDIYPVPVSIAPVIVAPSAVGTSAPVSLSGFVGTLQLSVTGGLVSVDSGAFVSGPVSVTSGQTYRLQGNASATPGATAVVGYSILSGSDVVGAGNFVIVSQGAASDTTPTAPVLNNITGATVGQYSIAGLFTVAGVSPDTDIPIVTGDGVQVRIATTTGGVLGAPQSGIINVRLGYDVMVIGLAVSGQMQRYLAYGGLLLSFSISAPPVSNLPYSIPQSRIWKIGASSAGAFPVGSELMRGPNGGIRAIKDPDSTVEYGIDYSQINASDPIVSATIIASGVTAVQKVLTANFVGFSVSGGNFTDQCKVTVRTTAVSGSVEDRSINFDIISL